MCGAVGVLVMGGVGTATAEDATPLTKNASECDISTALGIAKPECQAVPVTPEPVFKSRGLQLGNPDQMQMPEASAKEPVPRPHVAHQSHSAAFQINFEFGSARLTGDATEILNRIGAVLTAPTAASVKFRITGHTDGVGSASRNLKLSEQRAEAVKAYLISNFNIDETRLESMGKGSRELLNRADPGAAENRRVEITNLGG